MNRRSFLFSAGAALSSFGLTTATAQVFPPVPVPRGAPSPSVVPLAPTDRTSTWFTDVSRGSFGKAKVGDDVFILGGHTGSFHCYPPHWITDQFLSYNVRSRKWKKLADYPFAVQSPNLVATPLGLFAFGGYRYDEAFHFVGCSVDGNGKTEQERDTYSARSDDQIFRFDPAHNTWEPWGQMPRRRSSAAAFSVNEKVYLVAGWDGTPSQRRDKDGRFHRSIDVLDLRTGSFIPFDHLMSGQVRRALASAEMNGKLVLVGGLTDGARPSPLRDVTIFNPDDGQFRELPPLPEPRFAPGACFTGKWLVVAGGLDFRQGLLSGVVFSDGASSWRRNNISLEAPAMFVDLVAVDEDTILALGAFGDPTPFPLIQEIKIQQ